MRRIKDGGPAFAFREGDGLGLSVRDYFAAKAMQGMLAAVHTDSEADGGVTPNEAANYAGDAYTIADAMLKQRDEPL